MILFRKTRKSNPIGGQISFVYNIYILFIYLFIYFIIIGLVLLTRGSLKSKPHTKLFLSVWFSFIGQLKKKGLVNRFFLFSCLFAHGETVTHFFFLLLMMNYTHVHQEKVFNVLKTWPRILSVTIQLVKFGFQIFN